MGVTVTDDYGDMGRVLDLWSGNVWLSVTEGRSRSALLLTPRQARKLAKALKRSARDGEALQRRA